MSDSDSFTNSFATRVQARVIIGVAVGCTTGLVLLVLAAVRYIRRWRAGGRIIVNAPGKDLELEEGDSVAQTPGETGVEKATCKDEIQSPQPEAGLSKPEAAAIYEEDAQIKQQTPRSDVRVVYNPDDPSTYPPSISSPAMSQGTVPMQVMAGKLYQGFPEV